MPSLLDSYPLDWADPRLQELRNALSTAFYRDRDIELIAADAGVPSARIVWQDPADRLWFHLLNEASAQLRVEPLLKVVRERRPALAARIDEICGPAPLLTARIPDDQAAALAAGDPRWRNFTDANLERRIFDDEETLLDIAFLQHGLDRARSVCRLRVSFGRKRFQGTGFRIGPTTLLTNHHVLHDWRDGARPATGVRAEFGYELDIAGSLREPLVITGVPATITGDAAHDFAVIETEEPLPADVPILPLRGATRPEVDDRVYIIQHPKGLPKKIAMHHNLVRYVDEDVVQYWTDTETGSSGSPVFDREWRVVALHHQWVQVGADDGVAFRNQGRAIGRVAGRLDELGVNLG